MIKQGITNYLRQQELYGHVVEKLRQLCPDPTQEEDVLDTARNLHTMFLYEYQKLGRERRLQSLHLFSALGGLAGFAAGLIVTLIFTAVFA